MERITDELGSVQVAAAADVTAEVGGVVGTTGQVVGASEKVTGEAATAAATEETAAAEATEATDTTEATEADPYQWTERLPEEPPKQEVKEEPKPEYGSSAARAAMEYFAKQRVKKEQEEPEYIYYEPGARKRESDGTRKGDVLQRLAAGVPEKIQDDSVIPQETLFAPARERLVIDTSDYRVFSVKDRYRVEGPAEERMTLTQIMDVFIPEREKTEAEKREEARRTLIHEGDQPMSAEEHRRRAELRKEAALRESEKNHDYYGELAILSDNMLAMGKTINKTVMVDSLDFYRLLYTAVEENGDIIGYRVSVLDKDKGHETRVLGVLPNYALGFEKYYLFRALTEDVRFVIDQETMDLVLEKIEK